MPRTWNYASKNLWRILFWINSNGWFGLQSRFLMEVWFECNSTYYVLVQFITKNQVYDIDSNDMLSKVCIDSNLNRFKRIRAVRIDLRNIKDRSFIQFDLRACNKQDDKQSIFANASSDGMYQMIWFKTDNSEISKCWR